MRGVLPKTDCEGAGDIVSGRYRPLYIAWGTGCVCVQGHPLHIFGFSFSAYFTSLLLCPSTQLPLPVLWPSPDSKLGSLGYFSSLSDHCTLVSHVHCLLLLLHRFCIYFFTIVFKHNSNSCLLTPSDQKQLSQVGQCIYLKKYVVLGWQQWSAYLVKFKVLCSNPIPPIHNEAK